MISSAQTLAFWPFAVTLALNAVIHFFSQDTLASGDVSSDQVWLPRNQQFRTYSTWKKESYLDNVSSCCDLDLEDSNNNKVFRMTLRLMMLHHHTKFGNKISSDSECRQTFTHILNLCCDLDLQGSSPIFPHDTLSNDGVLSNQVWLQTNQQFRRHNRNSHILII